MSGQGDVYHEGEIAVQERAGVRDSARKVGGIVRETLPPAAAAFAEEQNFAVAGFADGAGRVWASLLVGEPGFLRATSEEVLTLETPPPAADPLADRLREAGENGLPLGLLVIDLLERKRMRANGTAYPRGGSGFDLHLAEVYSNCPKYIQSRVVAPRASDGGGGTAHVARGALLTDGQRALLAGADTLFIATRHPERGVDASHRGGMPGFVRVLDGSTLAFPDYAGNRMFNTLGNLQVAPEAGLLFVDWATGGTLQLTGEARVLWAEEVAELERATGAPLVGAQGRAVRFTLREWRQTAATAAGGVLESRFVAYSPANPVPPP